MRHATRTIFSPYRICPIGAEEIMSPYAASIVFLLPAQIRDYLSKIPPSPRGEIEMQIAVQRMIEDGYRAFGLLQPAPQEWSPEFIEKVEPS